MRVALSFEPYVAAGVLNWPLFTRTMSSKPSLSKSMNAQPPPVVSGIHFLPNVPLKWRKVMPARSVTSVNCAAGAATAAGGADIRVATAPELDFDALGQP